VTKRVDIVVTTIFEPKFLDGYVENIRRHGHEGVRIIVIPDRKTPASVYERSAFHGAICPTLDEQEVFLTRFPSMAQRIPYDSDNRRNIGFLMALDGGADLLITIDDDNYCLDDSDFVREHLAAGEMVSDDEVHSSDGWFNICSLLEANTPAEIWPRGFPYFARRQAKEITRKTAPAARAAMNVGLWLSDPDVDALTRLALAPNIERHHGESVRLGADTWSPINTQNTAIVRDAITAYYYVRMGFSLGGLRIDRYGDICSGYFLQKCVKARGEAIRVGTPIADHRRTPHNLFKDLSQELAGMVLLDDILGWLVELKLDGGSYRDLYAALADAIEEKAAAMRGFVWDEGGREFLRDTAANMRAWLAAVALIG
jgi:glycosyltransferase involved in cell wall biosynthesis